MGVKKSYKEYWLPTWPRPSFEIGRLLQQIVNARDPLQKFNELKERIPSPYRECAERMASLAKKEKTQELTEKYQKLLKKHDYGQ